MIAKEFVILLHFVRLRAILLQKFRFWKICEKWPKMPIFGRFFDIKWSLTCDLSNSWRCGLSYLVLFFLLFNNSLSNQKFKMRPKKISAKYRFFRLFAGNYRFFLELEILNSLKVKLYDLIIHYWNCLKTSSTFKNFEFEKKPVIFGEKSEKSVFRKYLFSGYLKFLI